MNLIKKVILGNEVEAFLNSISEREGKYGPYMMWEFLDKNDVRYVGFTETVIVPGNKLWVWLQSLGYTLNVDDTFDFSCLGRLKCRIFLRKRDKVVVHITSITSSEESSELPTKQSVNQIQKIDQKVTSDDLLDKQVKDLFS